MKSLDDIKQDMSQLYEEVRSGVVELHTASELANIAGADRRGFTDLDAV